MAHIPPDFMAVLVLLSLVFDLLWYLVEEWVVVEGDETAHSVEMTL